MRGRSQLCAGSGFRLLLPARRPGPECNPTGGEGGVLSGNVRRIVRQASGKIALTLDAPRCGQSPQPHCASLPLSGVFRKNSAHGIWVGLVADGALAVVASYIQPAPGAVIEENLH